MCENYHVVYIEEVVLDNLVINSILLAVTVALLREKLVPFRIFVAAATGTLFAVFLPFIESGLILYKLASLFMTTLFVVKHRKIKSYVLFVLVFAAVSFAAGGAAYGLFGFAAGQNGALSYPAGKAVKFAVYGALLFLLVVLRQIRRFVVRRRISASNGVKATLKIGDSRFDVICMNDTGNGLVDILTSKPVMVLSHDVGAHYVREGGRTLEVGTVNSVKNLPLITADTMTLSTEEGERTFEKMPVVVSDTTFDGYKLIVNFNAL